MSNLKKCEKEQVLKTDGNNGWVIMDGDEYLIVKETGDLIELYGIQHFFSIAKNSQKDKSIVVVLNTTEPTEIPILFNVNWNIVSIYYVEEEV